jgi:hypothetical protein
MAVVEGKLRVCRPMALLRHAGRPSGYPLVGEDQK